MVSVNQIFKAYDIRGKVGSELTVDIVDSIGRAFADWLPKQGIVVVGRDMRSDSAQLADAMIHGLTQQGRDVWDIGEVTSDMIYYAVGQYNLSGGAMITASHNPGQYNGLKLCREDAQPVGEETGLLEIRDAVIQHLFKPTTKLGKVVPKDITEGWINHVLSFVDVAKLKPLKIAIDAGNGMAGKIIPELEPYVPFNITEMYFELDGTFPNHEANPLKFETLKEIISIIKTKKLDAGIAFDGDGDRAFLIDNKGKIITGGELSAMLAVYFLAKYPHATIIYDARNSRTVPEIIEAKGGLAVRTKVGHSPMKQAMRQVGAVFGGEASGHFYFRDNWYADSGLIAALIGLAILSASKQKLSEFRQIYAHYKSIPETNFTVKDKALVLRKIEAGFKEGSVDRLDGLTLSFSDGWLNIRPSNTEPLLRLNAEAKTSIKLNEYVARAVAIIQKNS